MQLHERYEWSYKVQYNEEAHSITFHAGAKPREGMTEAPSKDDPEYEAFEFMCAEWQACVVAFRETLEQDGLEVRHSIGEINTNLSTEEITIFKDTLTLSKEVDVEKVFENMEPRLVILNEMIADLNNYQSEVQAATN